jgi:hypothetical protein
MDRIKQQSLIVLVETIETQLAAIKNIIYLSEAPTMMSIKPQIENLNYTSEEEDNQIERSLELREEERDKLFLETLALAKESIKDDTERL